MAAEGSQIMWMGGRGGWHVFVKRLSWPRHRQTAPISESRRLRKHCPPRYTHPVTEMKAGYTGGDIDLLRIHSREDMDKCKIYSVRWTGGGG